VTNIYIEEILFGVRNKKKKNEINYLEYSEQEGLVCPGQKIG